MLSGKQKRALAATLVSSLYLLLSIAIVEQILHAERAKQMNLARSNVNLQLMTAKGALESAVVLDAYVGNSVATLATVAPDVVEKNWSVIGRQFMEKSTHARSVALAPNDVIAYIYPLQGNEKALGLDLRSQAEQYNTIQQARNRQTVMIAGPVSLVQGGMGVVVRYPVFSDFPENHHYWGNVSVVIDFEQLMQHAGVASINGATVAIRGKDAKGEQGEVFFGDNTLFSQADLTLPINLPSGSWLLAAKYQDHALAAKGTQSYIIRAALYLLCIICYIALFLFYQSYKRSRNYAYYDELTGLANRRMAMQKLSELADEGTAKAQYALLNIDLNHFKQVNDGYGHAAGDALLQFVGQQLKRRLRSSDLVARMGGDEFLVVLYRLETLAQAQMQANKLLQHFATTRLSWQGTEFTASLSIGVAHSNEVNGNVEALLTLADKRMYQHKTAQQSSAG